MPYPYVIGEEKIVRLSNDEREVIKKTDKLMSEMEASLAANGDSQQLRDLKQFRKHFHIVTSDRLYDGRIDSATAKKQYAQSVKWIEEFMNNPVKAASLKNLFDSYKNGIGASEFDASLYVLETSLGIDYDSDIIDEMKPKVLKDATLLEKSGTIEEKNFSENETFGQDKEVEKYLEKQKQIEEERKKSAAKNDLFTRPREPEPEVKEPDYSNETDTYSYEHGRDKFDKLSSDVKHSFFDLREKMSVIEMQLQNSGKTKELSALKEFHNCLHNITNSSLYHSTIYSSENARKVYAESQNGLKKIMGDPKELAGVMSTIGAYGNEEVLDNLEFCLMYLSDTFGIDYDLNKAKNMVNKDGTAIEDTVVEEVQPEPEKKNVASGSAVNTEPEKKDVTSGSDVKNEPEKNVTSGNVEVKAPVNTTAEAPKNNEIFKLDDEDMLVRSGHAAIPVERTLTRLAPDLKARHRVSFIGGGQSKEMQNVQKDVDDFIKFCNEPNDPQFAGIGEETLLNNLKKSAQEYIAEKKKGRWGNTDSPDWRPNTEMGKKRYEAVLGILQVVQERLEQLADQKSMDAYTSSAKAPADAAADQVKGVPDAAADAPAEKAKENPTVENKLGNDKNNVINPSSDVTNVKGEEIPEIEIDESQLDNIAGKEKVNMDALYEGKQNAFDMADQDVSIGSIARYQNNIRTILNQGKPAPENFEKMKNDLGKEYAGIIATKCIWKKSGDKIGDVYKKEGPDSYKEQKKTFETDKRKRDTIQDQLINKDKGFDRMMAGVKDWKGAVDMSIKALTPNASEMLRNYVSNKKLTAINNKSHTTTRTLGPKKEI